MEEINFSLVSLRIVKIGDLKIKGDKKISKPEDAADILQKLIAESDRENIVVICLDTANQVTCIQTVSIGTLNEATTHPREVFKIAILSNSNSIILGHNHPRQIHEANLFHN